MGKKRPGERTCIGCGKKTHKKELFRFVIQEKGKIVFDLKQQKSGRGGYFCPKEKCFFLAFKKKKKLALRFREELVFDPEEVVEGIRSKLFQEMKRIKEIDFKSLEERNQLEEKLSLEDLQIIISKKHFNRRSICRG